MNDRQEIIYYETATNFMTPPLQKNFEWGMEHLDAFTSETGRPPMTSFDYKIMFRINYACGLRQGETLSLIREDFDLKHRILKLWYPKTAKEGFQKTTIPPYLVPTLEVYLKRFSNSDQIFPINRQNAWRYAKDAGRLGGVEMYEEHELHDIEGVWTHAFRKACTKLMMYFGASRELRMLKLRHSDKDAHDTYDKPDLNTLLAWEAKHLALDPILTWRPAVA